MHTQSLRSRARVGLRPLHKIAKTEDELALQFEAANAGLRKYNATRDRWHEWTGQVWKPDETGSVLDAIRDHIRFAAPPEMHKSGSVRGVESLCRRARVFARIQSDFDRDIYLLGTPEGTVDLRTGRLRKSDPADLISRSTSVSPQAGEPERWLQFLSEATGNDAEYVRHLKQLSGMFLTGDTREHRLSFAYGDGGTGKSTFVNTLGRIWGDYARTAPMETFAGIFYDPDDLCFEQTAKEGPLFVAMTRT